MLGAAEKRSSIRAPTVAFSHEKLWLLSRLFICRWSFCSLRRLPQSRAAEIAAPSILTTPRPTVSACHLFPTIILVSLNLALIHPPPTHPLLGFTPYMAPSHGQLPPYLTATWRNLSVAFAILVSFGDLIAGTHSLTHDLSKVLDSNHQIFHVESMIVGFLASFFSSWRSVTNNVEGGY